MLVIAISFPVNNLRYLISNPSYYSFYLVSHLFPAITIPHLMLKVYIIANLNFKTPVYFPLTTNVPAIFSDYRDHTHTPIPKIRLQYIQQL